MRIRILGMSAFEGERLDKQPWHARAWLRVWNEDALVIKANPRLWRREGRSDSDGGSSRELHGGYGVGVAVLGAVT